MPTVEPAVGQRGRRREVAALIIWIPVATAAQLLRMPGQRPWRALIAEDGRIFLGDALADPIGSLLHTYNSYYQLVCRAMGTLATVFPLSDAAVVFAVGGAVVASMLSVYVYVASRSAFDTRWARALMAALSVLAPAAVFEVSATGLELHWYFLFACFWALWSVEDGTKPRTAADSVVAFLTAWSSPLAALYAPLALRRAAIGRGRGRWVVLSAWASGVIVQGGYVLTHKSPERFSGLYLPDIPVLYMQRVVGSLLVGDQYLARAWLRIGWLMVVITGLVAVAVCIYGLAVARRRRLFILTAAAYSVLLTIASLVVRGTVEARWPLHQTTPAGSRYFFVPVLLLAAVFIAIADSPGAHRWARVFPALLVAAVAAASFAPPTARGVAPSWRASVRIATETCRSPDDVLFINIVPLGGDWFVPVTCRRARAG